MFFFMVFLILVVGKIIYNKVFGHNYVHCRTLKQNIKKVFGLFAIKYFIYH